VLEGAREHNLQDVTVEFPLQRLVVVTGVSGSGKSTLVQDVLAPALLRHFGQATETPGAHDRLLGADHLSDVVFVDQSPIGKTARSNPVSYVGAWDAIRDLFATRRWRASAATPPAKFSFNSGDGRCPTCGGSGFEHVEMQFLSDVYLRCPDCDGQRYRPEMLEVKLADARATHAAERGRRAGPDGERGGALFAQRPRGDPRAAAHRRRGLEYVRLGQPVPTLSGGEAQRLKLAGFLAEAAAKACQPQPAPAAGHQGHAVPVRRAHHRAALRRHRQADARLAQAAGGGHSLIVIEHNLDVIRASDWLIDLGPEGGDAAACWCKARPKSAPARHVSHTAAAPCATTRGAGGAGPRPQECASRAPHTGRAQEGPRPPRTGRAKWLRRPDPAIQPETPSASSTPSEHNLKGLGGHPARQVQRDHRRQRSGKSTLAFDILFNEGQRRYLESLNAYARSIVQPAGRPEVDAVYGIPPTVAIEQRLSRGGRKSTVGTTTEVWHFLRLLYVKLGTQHCVHDGARCSRKRPTASPPS
jgi:excinuclease ABC subunit A